jgi:hypothetical protein
MSRTLVGAFALFLVFTLGGCEDSAGVGGSGTLSILLTDDPGFLEAWVNVTRVELVGGGDGEGEGGEVVVLRDEPFEADLLTLANEVAILVDGTTVPQGTYSQLRFIIPDACIVLQEGDGPIEVYASDGYPACDDPEREGPVVEGSLQLPSYDQTGIKVQLPNELLTVSEEQAWLVDFDVPESFAHEAGNSGKWVMHPVIKAEDMSQSRNIDVNLTLGTLVLGENETLADYFEARLDDNPEVVAFADPEDDGTFTASFTYLLPGQEYDVWVDLIDGLSLSYVLDLELPQTVNLTSDQDEIVSFVVNALEEP